MWLTASPTVLCATRQRGVPGARPSGNPRARRRIRLPGQANRGVPRGAPAGLGRHRMTYITSGARVAHRSPSVTGAPIATAAAAGSGENGGGGLRVVRLVRFSEPSWGLSTDLVHRAGRYALFMRTKSMECPRAAGCRPRVLAASVGRDPRRTEECCGGVAPASRPDDGRRDTGRAAVSSGARLIPWGEQTSFKPRPVRRERRSRWRMWSIPVTRIRPPVHREGPVLRV